MTKPDPPEDPGESETVAEARGPLCETVEGRRDSHTDSWRVRSESEDEAVGEHADELVGQVVAGRYLVKGLLGRGGMGAVYHAEHTELQKQVALKILHRYMTTNKEVVARFEREAVAAGRLAHPSIVAAFDFGLIEDGSFYLALEFIDGRSLSDLLEREGVLAPERALAIAYQINDALCTAHAAGIVHRDMKPDNVLLVSASEGDDVVKVVDFGIAKVSLDDEQQEGLTRAGLVFGTPEYMSPEQALGHATDARSDLYGVGMLLYEMLAGRSPFSAEGVTEMLRAQIQDEPPPLPAQVPERLRDIVDWLLKKAPDERPESAALLAEAFVDAAIALKCALPPPRTATGVRSEGSKKPTSHSRADRGSQQGLSLPPPSKRRKSIPLWLPLGALFVGVGVGVAAMLMNEEAVPSKEVREQRALIDAEAQTIVEVTGGDRDAIFELRRLAAFKQKELERAGVLSRADAGEKGAAPSKKLDRELAEAISKQANRYFVLGRGYSIIKHYTAAIEMYREAVRLDPYLSDEPELLLDVREAILARDAVEDGLDFALKSLGAHGADMIYDVYVDYKGEAGMTPVVARAMKIAESDELMEQSTPALALALRLERAKLCGEYRDIIPDAVKHADDRSLEKLRILQLDRGCGSDGKKDCFICLRQEGVDLEGAVKRAEETPSPTFLRDDSESE